MPASAVKCVQLVTTGDTTSYGSTGPAATRRMTGVEDALLKINEKYVVVNNIGNLGPGQVGAEVAQSAEGKLEGVLSYEDGPRILNGFISAIGASTITSGAPYSYPYTAPTNSTQSVYTYPIEFGSSGAAYRALGSVFQKLTLKGEAGDFWRYSVDFIGKSIIASSLTTGLSDPSIDPVRMADTSFSLDSFSTGTAGSSAVTGTLKSFELSVDTKRHNKQFAGSINPTDWGEGKWDASLKTVCEFSTAAKAVVDELLGSTGAASGRQIRISATKGSSASVKTARFDFAGMRVDGETLFGDADGNITVEFNWAGRESTALGTFLACLFQNGSSSTT